MSRRGNIRLEKIRELSILLTTGINDYENQLKTLQEERLKFLRLSLTDNFGEEEGTSKESWLIHLKDIEDTLHIRLRAMRQAICDAAADIQANQPGARQNL